MTQQAALYPGLSVEENVRFFAAINGVDGGVKEALEFVDLYDRRRLSRGDAQRRHAAAVLAGVRPGPSPEAAAARRADGRRRPAAPRRSSGSSSGGWPPTGTTIIVSSHVMDEAERCQRLGLIQYGRLLAEGTPV